MKIIRRRGSFEWPSLRAAVPAMLLCMAVTVVHAEPQPDPAAQARRILQEGVESKDSAVRIQAITAASLVGNHEVVLKSLEASLQDKSVAVRLAAVHALADIGSPQSVQALQQVLQDDKVPEVYFAAAKALAKLHDPEGTRALMEVFEGKRKASSNIIEKQKREATDQFHSVPSAMMFMVSHGIGYVPIPGVGEGFSALTALTHDVELSDRATVILILGQSKSGESRELLSRALDDKDWSVRAAAVQMIAQGARVEMRNQLLPLFDDTNHKVRFRAAGAYLHLALIKSH